MDLRKITLTLGLFTALTAFGQTEPSGKLPLIIINAESILDEPKLPAEMEILWNEVESNTSATHFSGRIGIELRGSSTYGNSFSIETRDANDDNLNVSLLGLPSENDWIIHGGGYDPTLIHNALAYELHRQLGRYAPRTVFCELILNGDYVGMVTFMEKIKRDDERVNLNKLKSSETAGIDLTGGYIFKFDKTTGHDPGDYWIPYDVKTGGWKSTGSYSTESRWVYHHPSADALTVEQKGYLEDFVTEFETMIMDEEIYKPYIDIPSFVDFAINAEISDNADVYRISTFYTKDHDYRCPKIKVGPPWDFDQAFGRSEFHENVDEWQVTFTEQLFNRPPWWEWLFYEADFAEEFACRWQALRSAQYSDQALMQTVDSLHGILENAFGQGWNQSEINFMKNWMLDRVDWMDNNLPAGCSLSQQDYSGLIVSEIMHTACPDSLGLFPDTEYDFIELYNSGNQSINLSGIRFEKGIDFVFPIGTSLNAGEYFVLASNDNALAARYPDYSGKVEYYNGTLRTEDHLIATDRFGEVILDIDIPTLNDSFPSITPCGLALVQDEYGYWTRSRQFWGSEGGPDDYSISDSLVISEVMPHTDLPQYDAIELFNPSNSSIDLTGWYISDDLTETPYRLGSGYSIPAQGYLSLNELDWGQHFRLSRMGDAVYVLPPNQQAIFTRSFTPEENGESQGVHTISTGAIHFTRQSNPSLGASNGSPFVSSVVIDQIFAGSNEIPPFIKLVNRADSVIHLFSIHSDTITWKLKGLDFQLPTGFSLMPDEEIYITNAGNVLPLRSALHLPGDYAVLEYQGTLQPQGERLALQFPDRPDTTNQNFTVPYVNYDVVDLDVNLGWTLPSNTMLLQRVERSTYSNDPINWVLAPFDEDCLGILGGTNFNENGDCLTTVSTSLQRQSFSTKSMLSTSTFEVNWNEPSEWKILDAVGKIMESGASSRINVGSNWSPGIYFLFVQQENSASSVTRLVRQ